MIGSGWKMQCCFRPLRNLKENGTPAPEPWTPPSGSPLDEREGPSPKSLSSISSLEELWILYSMWDITDNMHLFLTRSRDDDSKISQFFIEDFLNWY